MDRIVGCRWEIEMRSGYLVYAFLSEMDNRKVSDCLSFSRCACSSLNVRMAYC